MRPLLLTEASAYVLGDTSESDRTIHRRNENVGNLVCPSSYDLGEDLRAVLMSVTEGEDKPLKYPTIFNTADIAVITKTDVAQAVEFDWETAKRNINAVRPGMDVIAVSSKNRRWYGAMGVAPAQQMKRLKAPPFAIAAH